MWETMQCGLSLYYLTMTIMIFFQTDSEYSSTCHERTPTGPSKSVRSLQVGADQRYFNVDMCRSGH